MRGIRRGQTPLDAAARSVTEIEKHPLSPALVLCRWDVQCDTYVMHGEVNLRRLSLKFGILPFVGITETHKEHEEVN